MGDHFKHYHLERGTGRVELNTPKIAEVLVKILKRYIDLKTVQHATEWLLRLSQDPSVLLSIYQSNGIPVLVELLNATDESVSFHAIEILRNLLFDQAGSKAAICKHFGLKKIMMILKNNNNEKFLAVIMQCLHVLAYKDPENKFILFCNDGPAELIRIMETCSCKSLLRITASVLQILSACSQYKDAIIAIGGVQALAKHLDNASQELVINCLLTLRNLSDAATKQENVAPLLKRLVQLLRSRDKNIVCCVVGILLNMTRTNAHNKELICIEKGVHALVNVILMPENDEEIIETAIRTLTHLTCNHSQEENAQNDLRLHLRLQSIKYLNPPIRWPLIKTVLLLLLNLASRPNNHELLLELDIVQFLKDMLHPAYQNILRHRESHSCREMKPTLIDGIEMEDIVDFILIAFLNLAPNAKIRTRMQDSDILKILSEIMNKGNRRIQFIISCIFYEFFPDTDPDCTFIIETPEGALHVSLPYRLEYVKAMKKKLICGVTWNQLPDELIKAPDHTDDEER